MQRLIDQIKRHEGFRSKVYRCSEGVETIGYGRNLRDVGVSMAEAEMMLTADIHRSRIEAETLPYWDDLNAVRKGVVINVLFNIGLPSWLRFKKANAALAVGDYETAALEMLDSKWATQVGGRAIELARQMRTGEF